MRGGRGQGSMPLPRGNGQGISPGAPTGEHFWPQKGHSKRTHFGFIGPFLVPRDCFSFRSQIDSKKLILHRKVKDFYCPQDLFGTRSPS